MPENKKYSTQEIKQMIITEAKRQGIDPNLALAVAQHESGFNNVAVSPKNTDGSRDHGVFQLNDKYHKLKNVYDPIENIAYGIKHLKGLLAGARGDVRKALSDYNAGANATGKGRKQGDAYAQKVMALMDNKSSGQVTGAAAPIPQSNNNSVGDIVQGALTDAEQIVEKYFKNKGYDPTYFKKVKEEASKEIDMAQKKIESLPTTASPEKVAEIQSAYQSAVDKAGQLYSDAVNMIQSGMEADKVSDYYNMMSKASDEQLARLEAANPYAQMAQKAPINLDDYARAVNRQQQTNAMIRANNIAMGGQATPVNFAEEAQQLAQARQAAEMARQTGLTPEQYIAMQQANYNAMGTNFNNMQQVLGELLSRAQAGDMQARQQLASLYTAQGTNALNAVQNQFATQRAEDAAALDRARFQAEQEQELLARRQQLDPYAVQAEATMQGKALQETGDTLRQGMQGGVQGAGQYLNYEAMLNRANAGSSPEADAIKVWSDVNKPILNAAGMSQNVNALPQAVSNYQAGFALNFPQYAQFVYPNAPQNSAIPAQPNTGFSQWTNQSFSPYQKPQQ